MTILTSLNRKIIIPIVALAFLLSACDSSNAVDDVNTSDDELSFDIAESISFIASDLELSSDEIAELQGAFGEYEGRHHEPGFLWNVAARLQANLTDEQKAKIFERIENRPFPQGHFESDRSRTSDFMNRKSGFGRAMFGVGGLFNLTDEQE